MKQWVRSHWRLLIACAPLFLVSVGVGSAGSGEAADAERRVVQKTVNATVAAGTVTNGSR